MNDRVVINTNEEDIFEMSNIRGNFVKVPHKLDFSFFFSRKGNSKHGIRVKVVFTPDKLDDDKLGILELSGKWEFIQNKDEKHILSRDIANMKQFFKDYKVLFAGVWERRIYEDSVLKYFEGYMTLKELVKDMKDYKEYKNVLDKVDSIKELEQTVRKYNIFNMND